MAVAGKRTRAKNPLTETIYIVVVAIALALGIQAFLVKPFRIPSESMVPTLAVSQRSSTNFIKRVVAVPGDVVKVLDGRVYIDGKLQHEPYAQPDARCELCRL